MTGIKRVVVALVVVMLFASIAVAKTYQFTGKVVAVTDSTIVVDKNGEKFEMSKDATTKTKGDIKIGSKVTVKYESRAVEVKK